MLLLPPGLTPPHLYVAGEEVGAMGMISVVTRGHRGHGLHEHGVMSSCSWHRNRAGDEGPHEGFRNHGEGPAWKQLLPLTHLKIYLDTMLNRCQPTVGRCEMWNGDTDATGFKILCMLTNPPPSPWLSNLCKPSYENLVPGHDNWHPRYLLYILCLADIIHHLT